MVMPKEARAEPATRKQEGQFWDSGQLISQRVLGEFTSQ